MCGRSDYSAVLVYAANNELRTLQTYARVSHISQSTGLTSGGERITVHGSYFDETNAAAAVYINGLSCDVMNVSHSHITCITPASPELNFTRYAGIQLIVKCIC